MAVGERQERLKYQSCGHFFTQAPQRASIGHCYSFARPWSVSKSGLVAFFEVKYMVFLYGGSTKTHILVCAKAFDPTNELLLRYGEK